MRKETGLRGPHRIVWRTGAKGFEYMARKLHESPHRSMVELHIAKFFPKDWEMELEVLRVKHRSAGLPDSKFTHTDLK